MEIKVVLTADEKLLSVLNLMGTALSGLNGLTASEIQPTVIKGGKNTQSASKEEAKKSDTPKTTANKSAANETDSKENVVEETQQSDGASILTIEDARLAASKLAGSGKQKELKAIFNTFEDAEGNPVAKLSAVQPKDYQAFIEAVKAKAEELGI